MAHDKVYGICENKCKVEVLPVTKAIAKSDIFTAAATRTADELYGKWIFIIPYPTGCTRANCIILSATIESENDKYLLPYNNQTLGERWDCAFKLEDDGIHVLCDYVKDTEDPSEYFATATFRVTFMIIPSERFIV